MNLKEKVLSKCARFGRILLNFAFRHRLGRNDLSARFWKFILGFTNRFVVYENSKETNRDHHYVPSLLLRRWRIGEKGPDKGQVWQFSFDRGNVEKEGISQIACHEDYYLFKDIHGDLSDFIEKKILSETLENFGSQVIKRINTSQNNPNLTPLEESTLAVFISHQITRVPAFYHAIEKFILLSLEENKIDISTLGDTSKMKESIIRNGVKLSIDELLTYTSRSVIEGVDNHKTYLSQQIAEYMAESIYQNNLHILEIPESGLNQFVISDNPVVLLDHDRNEILQYPAWWRMASDRVSVFMPISTTRCVVYLSPRVHKDLVDNERESLVRLVNFGQYLNATDEVVGKDKETILRHLAMYNSELGNLRR